MSVAQKVMLNVRVDPIVMQRLDSVIEQSANSGVRKTKQDLVSQAILSTFPDSESLPVIDAEWIAPVDPNSNAALFDYLDEIEAAETGWIH